MRKNREKCRLVVVPALNPGVRSLCCKPYPGHPRGCPNWGQRDSCPPRAPFLTDVLDLSKPVYCIYNEFDLATHVARMREKHPEWSERQARCCLYWQQTARKSLREKLGRFSLEQPEYIVLYVPEACGVDVTATMASIGIHLEWPPISIAYQVALAGMPISGSEYPAWQSE